MKAGDRLPAKAYCAYRVGRAAAIFEVGMFGWFRSKSLDEVLNPTRVIYVHGVRFKIRKLNPMDYLGGSRAVRQIFETVKPGDSLAEVTIQQTQQQDIERHFLDTFLLSVLEPRLKDAPAGPTDDAGTPVRNLVTDWEFANSLYRQIIEFSYGKKKVQYISSRIGFSKPT
jgi:hypothetical protein